MKAGLSMLTQRAMRKVKKLTIGRTGIRLKTRQTRDLSWRERSAGLMWERGWQRTLTGEGSKVGTEPTIAIGLVHWRRPDWGTESVASLRAATHGEPIEIVVVDNSYMEIPYRCGAGETRVLSSENVGYAGGANLLIKELRRTTNPDIYIICCHDVQVDPGIIRLVRAVLTEIPDVGVVGVHSSDAAAERASTPHARGATVRDVAWVSGTCISLTKECLESIGGFASDLHSYVEDVEICIRARKAGFRIVTVDGLTVGSRGSATPAIGSLVDKNWMTVALRHRGRRGGVSYLLQIGARTIRTALWAATKIAEGSQRQEPLAVLKERLRVFVDSCSQLSRYRKTRHRRQS